VEPVSTLQFFPGDSLDDVQQFLGDQAFDFVEGLPLKNGAEIVSFAGGTLAEDQRSNLFKQRRWRIQYLFLEFFAALELGQFRKLTARERYGSFARTFALPPTVDAARSGPSTKRAC